MDLTCFYHIPPAPQLTAVGAGSPQSYPLVSARRYQWGKRRNPEADGRNPGPGNSGGPQQIGVLSLPQPTWTVSISEGYDSGGYDSGGHTSEGHQSPEDKWESKKKVDWL